MCGVPLYMYVYISFVACEFNANIGAEMNKRESNVSKVKGAGPSALTKEKPTKAERRATQEAQRAAKAAAKEAGKFPGKYIPCRGDIFWSLIHVVTY